LDHKVMVVTVVMEVIILLEPMDLMLQLIQLPAAVVAAAAAMVVLDIMAETAEMVVLDTCISYTKYMILLTKFRVTNYINNVICKLSVSSFLLGDKYEFS